MRKYTILVTGVGAIIGYGIISSLRKSRYDCRIIGMDIYEDAVGQVWCDDFLQAVPAADDQYINFLKNAIEKYRVDLVFFGTEQEMQKCNANRKELGTYADRLVLNREDIIALSEDKWLTTCFLRDHGMNYIRGSVTADFEQAKKEFGLPLLLKPRRSYASKGLCVVTEKDEFDSWKNIQRDNFMVQELVGDNEHEYTAATFGFGDGTCIQPIVLRRKLSRAGATDKAIVEEVPGINKEIYCLVKALKPVGPVNFQFRLHKGKYLLLEINPRISSSTSIRTAYGYNEAEMCIEYYLENRRVENRRIKTGKAYRYITEVIIDDDGNHI